MGLLDDLKSQAEQNNKPAGEQPALAGAEEFYHAQVKPRMLKANGFLTQLVNQLNEMKLVIKAEYPFRPEGKTVTLLQQGYKVYSDHITEPRQVTLGFTCILANPTTFDVRGRAPALAQGEQLERYQFKYEKLEARDKNRMVIGARFKLLGPLQVKCVLEFDEVKQIIKLLLTNFVGPSTSQYNLKPEQLDEAFMDRLGKYLLRKEARLFQEEISDDAKVLLRRKLLQEQLQREAELRAAEEQRKAEEEARKQNSTTAQLKKAVSQSVAENTERLKKAMDEQVRDKGEKLKTMFNKLKNRVGSETAPEQTSASPAVITGQTVRPTGNPAVPGLPPVNRQAGQVASAQQNATRPTPSADQKKPTSPKVFVSSASNPFLKPEDFAPVPRGDEEQTEESADTKNPAAQLPSETTTPVTAKTPTPTMPPAAAQVRPTDAFDASATKTVNPFLPTKAVTVQAEMNKPTGQSPAQSAAPATLMMSPAAEAKPVVAPNASGTKPVNPFLQTKATAVRAETNKPTGQTPVQAATPATPTTSPAAEAKPVAAPNTSVETASSSMQTTLPAASAEADLSLEPTASDAESSSLAAPAEAGLSLESPVSDAESSSPPAPVEAGLSLESTASDAESTSPAAPAEATLSLEPATSNSGSSSPAAPAEAKMTMEPTVSDSEASSLATKAAEPQPEPSSDLTALSMEDELERDLARFMENGQQQPSIQGETSDASSSTSDEVYFDLSSPDALEIYFEDTEKASNQDKSEPTK